MMLKGLCLMLNARYLPSDVRSILLVMMQILLEAQPSALHTFQFCSSLTIYCMCGAEWPTL